MVESGVHAQGEHANIHDQERGEAVSLGQENESQAGQQPADSYHRPGSEPVNQVPCQRPFEAAFHTSQAVGQ